MRSETDRPPADTGSTRPSRKGAPGPFRRHRDGWLLALLVVAGLMPRLLVQLYAPVFYDTDVPGYVQPAHDLLAGEGLTNRFKRPIGYPLVLASIFSGFGPRLLAVTATQHVVGLLILGLTYVLGRVCYNRWVGLGAGLLMAISGAQLTYEHLPIPEPLFILLLVGLVLVLIRATRAPTRRPALLVGLLLGLATLVKPIGQAILPLAMLFAALRPGSRRERLLSATLLAVGFTLVVAPAMFRNLAIYGRFSVGGSLGDSLLALTTEHYRGRFVFDDPSIPPDPEPSRQAARRIIQAGIAHRDNSGEIRDRVRAELGLPEEQSDILFRQLCLEVIRRQPLVFLSTIPQSLARMHLVDERSPARNRDLARSWSQLATLGSLAETSGPAREDGWPRAEAALSLYRPASLGLILPLLGLVSLVLAARAPPRRGTARLLVGLLWAYLLLIHAALDGPVQRYRYILEPLLDVLVVGAIWMALRFVSRRRAAVPIGATAGR